MLLNSELRIFRLPHRWRASLSRCCWTSTRKSSPRCTANRSAAATLDAAALAATLVAAAFIHGRTYPRSFGGQPLPLVAAASGRCPAYPLEKQPSAKTGACCYDGWVGTGSLCTAASSSPSRRRSSSTPPSPLRARYTRQPPAGSNHKLCQPTSFASPILALCHTPSHSPDPYLK